MQARTRQSAARCVSPLFCSGATRQAGVILSSASVQLPRFTLLAISMFLVVVRSFIHFVLQESGLTVSVSGGALNTQPRTRTLLFFGASRAVHCTQCWQASHAQRRQDNDKIFTRVIRKQRHKLNALCFGCAEFFQERFFGSRLSTCSLALAAMLTRCAQSGPQLRCRRKLAFHRWRFWSGEPSHPRRW